MAKFLVEKTIDYTVMSNFHLRDSSLSLKAKGLLSQMLSLPDNWDYTLSGLAKINRESKDAIRAAVNELEAAGYIQRRQTTDESGKFASNEYIIRECPNTSSPLSENPTTDNPSTENPSLEKPLTENPTQLNKDISSKDISEKKSKKENPPPSKKKKSSTVDFDPKPLFIAWINNTLVYCDSGSKNALYLAMVRFAENRVAIKKPMKSQAAVTALCNKLMRLSDGSLPVMIDMLDTATASNWQSVFAPKSGPPKPVYQQGSKREWEEL